MLSEAKVMEPKIREGIEKYGKKINTARRRAFFFNMMLVNFALEEYSEALEFQNKLMEKSPHREDLSVGGRLFELIILYKQKSHINLDTRVKALTENLKYNQGYNDFERTVLLLLSKLIRFDQVHPNESNRSKHLLPLFEKAKEDMEAMLNNKEFVIPESFMATHTWILSEIENRPFKSYLNPANP
jgi:hypothetical protein